MYFARMLTKDYPASMTLTLADVVKDTLPSNLRKVVTAARYSLQSY